MRRCNPVPWRILNKYVESIDRLFAESYSLNFTDTLIEPPGSPS